MVRRTMFFITAALALSALAAPTAEAVLATYADIAQAGYEDSWLTAKNLPTAVDAFLAAPGAATHQAAKDVWLAARVPYQQTEAYRFGNAIVDDWEGRVNAWPLDEGLIDYVAASYGSESYRAPVVDAEQTATAWDNHLALAPRAAAG